MKGFRIYFLIIGVLALITCKKDPVYTGEEPDNPYDLVIYPMDSVISVEPDPATITGLHKNIFSIKCANPGCHDGNFEPDFRTVMSAYNTLVYHKVVKNSPDSSFKYRVLPYDTGASWLHERLTTHDAVLGRMPLYANPLSASEMAHLEAWILNGAKDLAGLPSTIPDSRPAVLGFIATDSAFNRIDTNRVNDEDYNSFYAPSNSSVKLIFLLEDDLTPVENLTLNQMKLGSDQDDFTSSLSMNAAYFLFPPSFKVWIVDLNTTGMPTGSTWYFRYFVNDGTHAQPTEFPYTALPDVYKTYCSLKIQ